MMEGVVMSPMNIEAARASRSFAAFDQDQTNMEDVGESS